LQGGVIDNKTKLNAKDLAANYLVSPGELVRVRHIRSDLATVLFLLNDPVSNVIMSCMFFTVLLLVFHVLGPLLAAYVYSEKRFDAYLNKSSGQADKSRWQDDPDFCDKLTGHWALWNGRYHYWQALGPAVGFILTVSGLVQSLHPVIRATNDLDSFMEGIHIAMISTFLGLLVRILALEAERVNNLLLVRADNRVSALNRTTAPTASK